MAALPIATVPRTPPTLSPSPICFISIVPVPPVELIVKSPKAVVAPILPAKSTAPDPEVMVKVLNPSTVELKETAPLLLAESVSIVIFSARVTGPVRVTTPD